MLKQSDELLLELRLATSIPFSELLTLTPEAIQYIVEILERQNSDNPQAGKQQYRYNSATDDPEAFLAQRREAIARQRI